MKIVCHVRIRFVPVPVVPGGGGVDRMEFTRVEGDEVLGTQLLYGTFGLPPMLAMLKRVVCSCGICRNRLISVAVT